ncbi:MAG: DUF4349 domain-containing protein, partial [Planctomycetaceae bacterium]
MKSLLPACILSFVVLASVLGCGQPLNQSAGERASAVQSRSDFREKSAAPPQGVQDLPGAAENAASSPSSNTGAVPKIERRIIYNTTLSLVVKDYNVFESRLPVLVESLGGFISKSETNRRYSDQQSGTWVARIPVDKYSEFLASVSGLGFAESRKEDAQDVTDEFVDVEARIANSKKLEERIVAMLEERTGKISDVLEIERELARVREEIERMQGRLRLLADRSALATVTIQCREEREYTPPTAPTLGSRIQQSWSESLATLQRVAENLLLAVVALAPWLGVFAVPFLIVIAMA